MNIDKNKFFSVQSYVCEFKDAQWRTIYTYEQKIGSVLVLTILTTIFTTFFAAFFLMSDNLGIFTLCLTIAFFLHNFILQGTQIMRWISKGTAYLFFGNKIDEKIVKVKNDARFELATLRETIEVMPDYGDWKEVKEQAIDIVNYKLV